MFRFFTNKTITSNIICFDVGFVSGALLHDNNTKNNSATTPLSSEPENTPPQFTNGKKSANKLKKDFTNQKIDPELQDMYHGEGEKSAYYQRR